MQWRIKLVWSICFNVALHLKKNIKSKIYLHGHSAAPSKMWGPAHLAYATFTTRLFRHWKNISCIFGSVYKIKVFNATFNNISVISCIKDMT